MSAIGTHNIDEILGKSHQRYFGAGYKHVKHNIEDIHIDPDKNNFDAMVSIQYPSSWSSKKTSKELKPHLSTIDVFVVAAQMCDVFMSHCFKLSEGESKQAWLRSLTVKAGKDSILDLSQIPLSGALIKSIKTDDSINGFLSEFKLTLGGFSLTLEVDHSALATKCSNSAITFKSLNEIFDADRRAYYGDQYAHIMHNIYISNMSPLEINGHLKFEKNSDYNPTSGIGAAFSGCYNPLDLMICGAQLSQVLVYQIDQLSRENTKNLWMRSVKVVCPQPLIKGGSFPIKVETKKTRLISKGGESWRMADLRATSPIDPDFYMESNVAHEIHDAIN
ncbi:AvrD family protein [Oceaniserpentilla sp. 4NH20-0058]|uniref:AvrD family protein n=1 Tax=Oceaniserpentilla sp. 4NH20-0058 TaxID=3127660 RepID=UPI003106629B